MTNITEDYSPITLITSNKGQSKLTLCRVPDKPGIAASIMTPIAQAGISVDVIVQNISHQGVTDFTFTVGSAQAAKAESILNDLVADLGVGKEQVLRDDDIANVTLIGSAMQHEPGIASKAFNALAEDGVNILLISTSDIKITLVIPARYEELAVRSLHQTFFDNS